MDFSFKTTTGKEFWMSFDQHETFLNIKQKIQNSQQIPVPNQTLKYRGNVLPDNLPILFSELWSGSQIQVVITNKKINLLLKMSSTSTAAAAAIINSRLISDVLELEMETTDTVKKLKEEFHRKNNFGDLLPVSAIIMRVINGAVAGGGVELQDQSTLEESQIDDGSEIEVSIVPVRSTTTTTTRRARPYAGAGGERRGGGGEGKVKITVLSRCGVKIPMEVNLRESIKVLRRELDMKNKDMNLNLEILEEDYFFIYDQNPISDENLPFYWYDIKRGDTVEIFNGRISNGS